MVTFVIENKETKLTHLSTQTGFNLLQIFSKLITQYPSGRTDNTRIWYLGLYVMFDNTEQ